MKQVTECRICHSPYLHKYLDLGNVPLCNALVTSYNPSNQKYPIKVLFCEDCFLSQLSVVIEPETLYTNYLYHSSVSKTFKDHCYKLGREIIEKFSSDGSCVDIASNDGCLIKEFKRAGFSKVLGIDPIAKEDSIEQIRGYWSEELANRLVLTTGKVSVITAQNVLAHVDNLDDFMRGVNCILSDDGVFIVEVPYLQNIIRGNQFDTIYHEHLSYFLFAPLLELFQNHNLPIFRVEHIPIHGGSLRIYASKNTYDEEKSVDDMLDFEELSGFYNHSNYISFTTKVDSVRNSILNELVNLYNSDKKVMGYGASAKGISLLNYCGIETPYIHSIVDETPEKQLKMTPGSHIDIVPFEAFEREKPDYILLLAWNFKEELMAKTKHLGAKYIIPIPDVRIL